MVHFWSTKPCTIYPKRSVCFFNFLIYGFCDFFRLNGAFSEDKIVNHISGTHCTLIGKRHIAYRNLTMSAFEWCLELPLASGLCDGRSSAARRRKSAAPAEEEEETLLAIPTPMDAHYTNTINTLLNYTELLENNIKSLTPSLTRTSHSI